MVRGPREYRPGGVHDGVQYLPPVVRMLAGAGMLGLGVTGVCLLFSYWSVVLLGLGGMVGAPLFLGGLFDWRTQRARSAR